MNIEIGDRVFCEKTFENNMFRFNGTVTEIRNFQNVKADLLILDCDRSPVSVRKKHVVKVEKAEPKTGNEKTEGVA